MRALRKVKPRSYKLGVSMLDSRDVGGMLLAHKGVRQQLIHGSMGAHNLVAVQNIDVDMISMRAGKQCEGEVLEASGVKLVRC